MYRSTTRGMGMSTLELLVGNMCTGMEACGLPRLLWLSVDSTAGKGITPNGAGPPSVIITITSHTDIRGEQGVPQSAVRRRTTARGPALLGGLKSSFHGEKSLLTNGAPDG